MNWLRNNLLSSAASSDESSEANGNNTAAGGTDHASGHRAWTGGCGVFEEAEPSRPSAAERASENASAGGMMDSMAYLTQPDATLDDYFNHDEEDENDDAEEGGDVDNDTEENRYQLDVHTPPPSQHSNKMRRRGGGRARRQSGDLLSKLQASPDGRQHSSNITATRNNDGIDTTPVPESPLQSPSPLIMSPQKNESSSNGGGNNKTDGSDLETRATTPTRKLDLGDAEDAKPTPPKSSMNLGEGATNNDHEQHENVDSGPTESIVNELSDAQHRNQGLQDTSPVGKPLPLSQSVVEYPSRSPSQLMMSRITTLPQKVDFSSKGVGDNKTDGLDFETRATTPTRTLDLGDIEDAKLSPSKSSMDVGEGATNNDHEQHENVDSGPTESIVNDLSEAQHRKQDLQDTPPVGKPSPLSQSVVESPLGSPFQLMMSRITTPLPQKIKSSSKGGGNNETDGLDFETTPVPESPLQSPSPLMMVRIATPLPQKIESSSKGTGNNKTDGSDFETRATPKRTLDLGDIEDVKPTPPKSSMDVDEDATNNDHEQHGHVDAGQTESIVNELSEAQLRKQRMLRRMNAKKRAIYRSLLHLSDNSYSFVYDDFDNSSRPTDALDENDEPGLPFIGPGVKQQYEMLRMLLRKGLLGHTEDDDEDDAKDDNDKRAIVKESEDGGKEDGGRTDADADGTDPSLPRIQSNVSAILMGPRGHGKTLVLERCLASLSRLAGKRKQRAAERTTAKKRHNDDRADETCSQSSFRVVRLNGLLFRGDSAVACTREIARQIGVMSREERRRARKRTRRTRQTGGGAKRRRHRSSPRSSGMVTPKPSKRRRKEEGSAAKKGAGSQTKLSMAASPAIATPLSLPGQAQTPDVPTHGDNAESHDFRIRNTGFNTYISLLDEVLRTARVDGIPVLIVLEEMDTFIARSSSARDADPSAGGGNSAQQRQDSGSNDRQLLLYHLLDRVADHKFSVSLVGMTTNLTTVAQLEKRVQSRAEGTSKIIYFGHDGSYGDLAESLLGKFRGPPEAAGEDGDDRDERNAMLDVRDEVEVVLRGGKSGGGRGNREGHEGEIDGFALVRRVLQRNYELIGSDMRWVCRVFDVALGLLASDIDECMHQHTEHAIDDKKEEGWDNIIPKLSPGHMAQALVTMSASLDDVSGTIGRPGIPTQSTMELIRWGQLLEDPKHYSCLLGTHPRLAALLDLSGPQVAFLLAARRIAARDDTRATAEDEVDDIRRKESAGGGTTVTTSVPLTYQRIQDEYTTSFVASGRYTISSDRYPPHLLHRSCTDLMELDIVRLRKEQCRGGALQYGHNDALSAGNNITNLPLHVNLDWELEFMGALKAGLLQCSTALREWGMNMN